MRSLRARLVIGTTTVTAFVFVVCGTALYVSIRAALWSEFDDATLTKARALAAMVEVRSRNRFMVELEDWQLPEFHRGARPEYFQVYWIEGKVTIRSDSLGNLELPMDGRSGSARPMTLPDGRPGRVVFLRFEPRLEDNSTMDQQPIGNAVLALARDTVTVEHVLTHVAWVLVVVCGGAIVAASALMMWIVRRALRPIGVLASQIEKVGDANLSERIPIEDTPRELRPLVSRINELLGRLDDALVRERAFSADVAHELRTPLSGLQTALEVASSQPRDIGEYQRVVSRCLEVTLRLHAMIDNLLTLARAEAGELKVASESISIEQVVRDSWAPLARRASEKKLHVTWDVSPPCETRSDRDLIALVIRNLLENAVSYSDPGGRVLINAASNGDGLKLRVTNSGSTIDQQQAQRVFERFWRGDSSRGGGAHCGLGLTLCRNIIRALGGSISVNSSRGGEFAVDVHVPG